MNRKLFRCAIYTRKSSEEGLEQEFNSLHAQREACEAYIKSQAHEGWRLISTAYDDGGFSGGSMDRPAMRNLLADVSGGLVDVVVVYKVDRLTRALADFAKIVETLDARGASFVSVTQQFNTTTSMGRLTLNVLLSFAQFEREVTGERIRDKFAASRRKGMWMGGPPPIGYDIRDRKLVVNEAEAEQVRTIFESYAGLGCVRRLAADLDRRDIRSKAWLSQAGVARGGRRFSRGALYAVLQNRTYLGMAVHKGSAYPGEHQAIVSQDLWERVQNRLAANRRSHVRSAESNQQLLSGLLFDDRGHRMSPSHAKKRNGRRYRYYVSQALLQNRNDAGSVARVPAHAIEDLVAQQFDQRLPDADRRAWRDLSPDDRAARLRVMVRRVVVHSDEVEIVVGDPRRRGDGRVMQATHEDDGEQSVTIRVPIRIKSWGGERAILTLDGTERVGRSQPDTALIKAAVRAHHWQEILEQGEVCSVAELAKGLGHHPSYVGSLLGCAFLAPDIVDALLAGRQPRRLTLGGLMACKFPLSWSAQHRALGFPKKL